MNLQEQGNLLAERSGRPLDEILFYLRTDQMQIRRDSALNRGNLKELAFGG